MIKLLFEPIRFRGIYWIRMILGGLIVFYALEQLGQVQALFGPQGIGGFTTHQAFPEVVFRQVEFFHAWDYLREIPQVAIIQGLFSLLVLAAGNFFST
ncbi:MAG: hypothetical protein MK135_06445 [Polyangiaceae bacterium]|nr:hypothetical protein [Polyangiaceae bacterium]